MKSSGTAQHALGPEAAAAGGVGISDAVLLVFLKQLAVTAVKAGCKFKFVEFSAEGLVGRASPDVRQGLPPDIAEAQWVIFRRMLCR